MTRFNFPRVAMGFNDVLHELERLHSPQNTFPPFNLEQLTDTSYMLTLACAGYTKDELSVSLDDQILIIKGDAVKDEKEPDYIHRGIAKRNFTKRIPLAKHFEVDSVTLKHGLLSVVVEQHIPDEEQPKTFKIK